MIKLREFFSECDDCERDQQSRDFTHGEDGNAPMSEGELRAIISNASKLLSTITPQDQLPAWVLAKITIASDNLASVSRYINQMEAEMQQSGPGYGMEEAVVPKNLSKEKRPSNGTSSGATSGNSDVRSPTQTHVTSPTSTKTSTDAYTSGNVTVTGGAGAGANTTVDIHSEPEKYKRLKSPKPGAYQKDPKSNQIDNGVINGAAKQRALQKR